MTDNNWNVEGRTFRTKHDYMAACRDKKKIDQIRKKIDFQNKVLLQKLQSEIQKGSLSFDSIVGTDFIDEINEIILKLEKEQNMKKKPFSKRKKENKKKGKIQPSKPDNTLEEMDDSLKKDVIQELKKRQMYHRLTVCMLGIIAICSLGYFTYYYYSSGSNESTVTNLSDLKNDQRFHNTEMIAENEQKIQRDVIDKYKTLYQVNKKLIGWVKIADTDIDYPVMQSKDDSFYLDHNFDNQKDRNGSIFMEAKCDAMTPSTNLIIYGHNMRSGKMFGTLNRYEKEEFYKNHKEIKFDTIYEEGTYEVMYAFRSQLYKETDIVFKYYQFIDALTEEEFNSNMNEMAKLSLYDTGVTASFGDHLLTLSTCDYNEKNGRFVVVAKKIN